MFQIIRLFLSLGIARLGEFKQHAGNRALYGTLMVTFAAIAAGFGTATITVALAREFGTLYALMIMTGAAIACLLLTLVFSKIADRRHREKLLEQQDVQDRLKQAALVSAVGMVGRPKTRKYALAGLGLAGLAMVVNRMRGDRS